MNKHLLFTGTPTVTVLDNRGLTVRDIAYHRHPDTLDTTDTRITHHAFDARGFLMHSADPRMQAAGRTNVRYQTNLAGSVLRAQGADAGTVVTLHDAAGRPCMTVSHIRTTDGVDDHSQAITHLWQYEDATLPGRPLSVTEQTADGVSRITERFVYAGNNQQARDRNLAGSLVAHYDPAGLLQTDRVALTGVPQSVTRRLIADADNPETVAHWQGEDVSTWNDLLAAPAYITLTTADATGAILTTTDAAGNRQRVVYDVAGQMSGSWLTLNAGQEQVIVASLTYSAAGQKLREEHGNGVVTTYTYEPQTQRLTSIKTARPAGHAVGAKVLQDLRYQYDPVGNVLRVRNEAEQARFWRNQKVEPEHTYAYDSLYQLVYATGRELANAGQQGSSLSSPAVPLLTDNAAYTHYTRTYTYDASGNLTQLRHSAPATNNNYTTDIAVSDRSNRGVMSALVPGGAEVETLFTAGGQQTQLLPGQQLAWTARNELRRVTQVQRAGSNDDSEHYRYDAGSQRVLKLGRQQTSSTWQSQRVVYLPGLEERVMTNGSETEVLQVISLGAGGGARVRVLHWESGQPEGISNNQVRYSHDDLIGSSGLEVDEEGRLISREEYYPYGGTAVWTARTAVEASYKTVRYSGKERDATGLYYYGYRYYQPWAGRWLSADPAGTVDGLNLYRMCRNNPVVLRDPDGRATVHAQAAYNRMVSGGSVWEGIRNHDGIKAISKLSSDNLKQLQSIKYSREEKNFLSYFKQQPFYMRHFTASDFRTEDGSLTLLSRVALTKKNITFNETNTASLDLGDFATDDFVFFSLEMGNESGKDSSRFGDVSYTVNLNDIHKKDMKYAHVQVTDLAQHDQRSTRTAPKWLSRSDVDLFFHGEIESHKATNLIFYGEDIIGGIGNRILNDLREFSKETRERVLAMREHKDINHVLNTLYRPQILFPHMLTLSKDLFKVNINPSKAAIYQGKKVYV